MVVGLGLEVPRGVFQFFGDDNVEKLFGLIFCSVFEVSDLVTRQTAIPCVERWRFPCYLNF